MLFLKKLRLWYHSPLGLTHRIAEVGPKNREISSYGRHLPRPKRRTLVRGMMIATACTLYFLLAGRIVVANENYDAQYVASFGSWTANVYVDTFDDRPVAWMVFAKDETNENEFMDSASIRYICDTRDSSLEITGHASGLFSSLGSMFGDKEIQVMIKVDDREIQEFEGIYPRTLIQQADIKRAYAELSNGLSLRVRTVSDNEMHTFKVSLYGFKEAVAWVHSNCPLEDPTSDS